MMHIFAMFLALIFPAPHHHAKVLDVIGGGPGGAIATPAPADVIGGGPGGG